MWWWLIGPELSHYFWANFRLTLGKPNCHLLRQNWPPKWCHCQIRQVTIGFQTPLVGLGVDYECRLWRTLLRLNQRWRSYYWLVPEPQGGSSRHPGERFQPPPNHGAGGDIVGLSWWKANGQTKYNLVPMFLNIIGIHNNVQWHLVYGPYMFQYFQGPSWSDLYE